MKDVKTILQNYIRAIRRRTVGIPYGETWQGKQNDFYEILRTHGELKNKQFIKFLKNKDQQIKTVLEIGCGSGIYPIKYKELFEGKKYTGIDISRSAIKYCKQHSDFSFIAGDFLKMDLHEKYDLVFSHAVINHVPDVDLFLKKIIQLCNKFAYIQATHGYYPDLEKHNMIWAKNESIYNTQLSVNQLKKTLMDFGLSKNQFIIKPEGEKLSLATVIAIHKEIS